MMAKKIKSYQHSKGRGYAGRAVDVREVRQRFLIVCEGEKTEPTYFINFRVPSVVVRVHGVGSNTVSVVRQAIELSTEDNFDQIWCVFDRDSFPIEHFNTAIEVAHQNGIHVAYSNEAFELWYLLHFQYLDTAMNRKDYYQLLNNHLGHEYQKNSVKIYEELLPYQMDALRNANRLMLEYDPPRPAQDNPSTTVHLLVSELNRYSAP